MDVLNQTARRQNNCKKCISSIPAKLTCLQFYRIIEREHVENILPVKEAFISKRAKQCIIVGKVAKLPSKIPNDIRRDIKKKCDPATFIIIREVVASSETVSYGRLYKVKFSGRIAQDILESDIKVGDRIALKNLTGIEENTEYCACARYSSLTPFALNDSETTIHIGKKVIEELRCRTPDSEDENLSSSRGNDRTEIEEHNSPAAKSSGLCSNNKRRFNSDCPAPSTLASPDKTIDKTPKKSKKMRVNSPKTLHVALEENEAEERNPRNVTSSRLATISQVSKYINLKDINESTVNKKVDIFGIVIDVLQSRENGKDRRLLRVRIIDPSIALHKAFEVLVFYTDAKPKICKRWIVRVKNVKIEAIRGEVNGRIFAPGCLICFPTEKGSPKFVTLRKKPYNFPDEDKQIVKNLKAFLAIQKSWNILALPNSYYADKHPGLYVPCLKLEEIKGNFQFFSLKCKIVSLRIFLEVKMAFLTVEDSTVCHCRTYQYPKTAKSWSAIVQNEEEYCENSSKIDILLKNLSHTCDSDAVNLLMQTGIFVEISEIQTRKMDLEKSNGLMFIVDMQKAKITQLEQPPPSSQENIPPQEGGSEELESYDESGVKISEYNALLAECRDESMSPTTAKMLAPIPEKKKEIQKRRKLVPTNSDVNVLLNSSTEDPVDENDLNRPMELDDEEVESRCLALERTNLSKSSEPSKLQSTQKENCDKSKKIESSKKTQISPVGTTKLPVLSVRKLTDDDIIQFSPKASSSPENTKKVIVNRPSSSEKTKIIPIELEKLPLLLVHKLTDDEIIQLTPNASICSKINKKGDHHSPNHENRKKTIIGPKSKDGETRCPSPRPCASSDAGSKEENVVYIHDASPSTSKQKEACFVEGSEQLPLNNETIDVDNFRSPHNEGSPAVEEMNQTVHEIESVEECSLIESGEISAKSKSKSKSKCSSDHKLVTRSIKKNWFTLHLRTRSLAKNVLESPLADSRSVISSSSRETDSGRNRTSKKNRMLPTSSPNSFPSKKKNLVESSPQNSDEKNTSNCNKTPFPSLPDALNLNPDPELDMDESILKIDGSDNDIFNPGKPSSSVRNLCSELPVAATRLRSANGENQVDGKSGATSSQTQFSPVVSSSLRKENIGNRIANIDVHRSPPSSIVTEKYFPTREPLKSTRKTIPQKRMRVELLLSPPVFSSPGSIATEKYNFTGERKMCTRKRIPHKTGFLQPLIEATNTSFCLEKWLQQVDSEIVLGESPVAEPLMDEGQNLQNLEESENLAEYMTLRDDVDSPSLGKIISDNAVIINSDPSIIDKPLDIVNGHCKEPCNSFFRYSILEFNANSKPICPRCYRAGKSIEVELFFLFKLNLMLHKSRNVCYSTLVHFNQATKFLGCTVQEYIDDEGVRSRVVNNLSGHFLLKGKKSSVVYSPSLHVNLRVTNDDGNGPAAVHLVDTTLPEPAASPPIQSFFSSFSNL
ncbi:hypothetical protein LSTR_LSTR004576 [Laodelphax striatellus]|uniref:Telomeric single stranded DNA binding POT1/Cdc13 domain-containing protein n=1 Tax=Laodelphax striatellus TaxID=195883 RepID=A0A482WTT9_LAOST|nr:hypothetical protein LSTR_LSTR004576 [Laodelphax striatellus]